MLKTMEVTITRDDKGYHTNIIIDGWCEGETTDDALPSHAAAMEEATQVCLMYSTNPNFRSVKLIDRSRLH